ncbi:MAG: disulfide bond formation protein B [Sphingobium sp.]
MTPALSLARLIALLTPLLLLGGAYASQYLGGLHPCEMCWWQRYPHMAAIPLAIAALLAKDSPRLTILLTALAALAIAVSGGIGLFHAGVEYGWWQGLTACSTTPTGGSTDILAAIMAAPITRCDVAPWTLFGLSLAGYNALLSVGAALAVLALLVRARPRQG